jgi:hypothetical protein
MNEPPVQPFDDPALKAALGRALDRERAPDALRKRVLAMAATGASGARSEKPLPLFKRSRLYRLAVAAILVIGFGGLGYQIWDMQREPTYDPTTAFSTSLYQAMLDAHAARSAKGASGDTAATLAAAGSLAPRVGRPVFVADLAKDGWTFEGGGVRKVGSDTAAQLYFTKGKAAVSVFSLPSSAAPGARDGQTYDASSQVKSLLAQHKGELSGS